LKSFDFFGVKIADTNLELAREFIIAYDFSKPNYVSFPDAYVVALCQRNNQIKSKLNKSLLTLPDGKPSALMGKRKGLKNIEPVSGFWLCKSLLDTPLSHYFLGTTPERLKKLEHRLKEQHPHAHIKGYSSPSFVTEETAAVKLAFKEEFDKINLLKPDLIWIGISSPKQDYIMHHHLPLLKHGLMLGVGGVFDYLSGEVNKSPEWIKKIGMRWAWRLAKEPKRMWRKYFYVFRTLGLKYVKQYLTG
jgi:N-acetylglucosaminyldiphosphoundecaprenol N-acetyl-beta-D-mannosaminyltransferase